ncbi:cytochrome c oxidase assembly factor 4 homolog, mitochondrial [Bradysia coprophila]|uniref:cytochrome c oxidase assembly factor 4 homolog, mitochondrial n=1 Tax=Bradysia coprophila TaxID=38358 RepID=UPI00187DA55A|nr:cytochrome c oxidase assembly factor 4 homolog, mitochondrial [Bradysia coprophila]
MSATVNDPNDDPVESMLKKTGCISLHYKVQECIAETQDWRKCQDIVKEFKGCMQAYVNQQQNKYSHHTKSN